MPIFADGLACQFLFVVDTFEVRGRHVKDPQILRDSYSVVSRPIFASKFRKRLFCSIFREVHILHTFAASKAQNIRKMLIFWKFDMIFVNLCKQLNEFAKFVVSRGDDVCQEFAALCKNVSVFNTKTKTVLKLWQWRYPISKMTLQNSQNSGGRNC